jgi:hypothetical protein
MRRHWSDSMRSAGLGCCAGGTPREVFTLVTDIVAVDGATAVMRAHVTHGDPVQEQYQDLWVLRFAEDGRCREFEEWPYWPGRPYSARPKPTTR